MSIIGAVAEPQEVTANGAEAAAGSKSTIGPAALSPAEGPTCPPDDEALQQVRILIATGDLHQAEALCTSLPDVRDHSGFQQLAGYIAQQTGRYDIAVERCSRARQLGLEDWSNYFILGYSLRALGRHAEALGALSAAHRLSPTRPDVIALLLEETFLVEGYDAAAALFLSSSSATTDPALKQLWHKLVFENAEDRASMPKGLVVAEQTTARQWARRHNMHVFHVEGVEPIPVEVPPVKDAITAPFKSILRSIDPYVADLRDVTIFSKSNIVLTPDNFAINEAGAHERYGHLVSHRSDRAVRGQNGNRLLIDVGSFEISKIDAGIMLSGCASDAFGHWVPEYLPKLQFLAHHPDFAHLPIIVDAEMPQSHYDYLANIARNELIRLRAGAGFQCGRLLYAPPATFFPVHLTSYDDIPAYEVCPVSPRSYRFLKARVEASLGVEPSQGRKYYLSRRNMTWRRVSNDRELAVFLEGRGFETVQIEHLSFEQQVRLFQHADCIVAANGSSMQNVIFSHRSLRLFVLTQSNLHNLGAFYGQTSSLGYEPVFVCGTAIGDAGQKHCDYVVSVKALASALDNAYSG